MIIMVNICDCTVCMSLISKNECAFVFVFFFVGIVKNKKKLNILTCIICELFKKGKYKKYL